jgi:hypothetical protein
MLSEFWKGPFFRHPTIRVSRVDRSRLKRELLNRFPSECAPHAHGNSKVRILRFEFAA